MSTLAVSPDPAHDAGHAAHPVRPHGGVAPIDIRMRDTYHVVAGPLFAPSTGDDYRAPKWTGHRLDEPRGQFHFRIRWCG